MQPDARQLRYHRSESRMPTTTDKPETPLPNASDTTKTIKIHNNWYANGFIYIEGCTSRIGIKGRILNNQQAIGLTTKLFCLQVPCACGTYTLVANFCLEPIKCKKCGEVMATEGGNMIKLTEHAMDAMACKECNSKYAWMTLPDIQREVRNTGFGKSKRPAKPPEASRIHTRKNIHNEDVFPVCSNPICRFKVADKSDEVYMVKCQLECDTERACALVAYGGKAIEALMIADRMIYA